ncbi:MAG: glycosyltransferase family 4 protein [Ignavibacteriae bacterium]|nr:glycosyltransferase family 4 protein [Ignavibacteriota bacterium]
MSGKPLRIMLISDYPYKGVIIGGLESAVQILAKALSELQAVEKVLVVNFRTNIDRDETVAINDKLDIAYVIGQKHYALPTKSYFDLVNARRIAAQFRPDVVHGQGTGMQGDIATRLGYPSAVTIHGVGVFEAELREKHHRFIGPIRVRLTKEMTKRVEHSAHVMISISEFDREYLAQTRSSNVVGIPNAVRSEFFERLPAPANGKRILFGGLIILRKNVAGLIRAFARVKQAVPDAVLDIVGLAPDAAYYKEVQSAMEDSLRESVIFHGGVNGDALVQLMNGASVSVLFSIYENLPCIIAESLALGKPVVSSRVGSIHEMVRDGYNGFLVESENEAALAERLILLLNDEQLRLNMGCRGRELAIERWLPEKVANDTVSAYRQAIAVAASNA